MPDLEKMGGEPLKGELTAEQIAAISGEILNSRGTEELLEEVEQIMGDLSKRIDSGEVLKDKDEDRVMELIKKLKNSPEKKYNMPGTSLTVAIDQATEKLSKFLNSNHEKNKPLH